jgi:hypothetical protein
MDYGGSSGYATEDMTDADEKIKRVGYVKLSCQQKFVIKIS